MHYQQQTEKKDKPANWHGFTPGDLACGNELQASPVSIYKNLRIRLMIIVSRTLNNIMVVMGK
jgi:hypothetical protein